MGDGRRLRPLTLRERLRASTGALQALVAAALFVAALYAVGPQLGVIFICATALVSFYILHKYGPRAKADGGYSLFNRNAARAAGELSSAELDASLRGLAPGQEALGRGGGGGAHLPPLAPALEPPQGQRLGSDGVVPEQNRLLAELAAERMRRRAAAAAAAES